MKHPDAKRILGQGRVRIQTLARGADSQYVDASELYNYVKRDPYDKHLEIVEERWVPLVKKVMLCFSFGHHAKLGLTGAHY